MAGVYSLVDKFSAGNLFEPDIARSAVRKLVVSVLQTAVTTQIWQPIDFLGRQDGGSKTTLSVGYYDHQA